MEIMASVKLHDWIVEFKWFMRRLRSAGMLVSLLVWSASATAGLDPFASNNTLYPTETGNKFRVSNYDYPTASGSVKYKSVTPMFDPYGAGGLPIKPLSTRAGGSSVKAYIKYVRDFITPAVQGAINDPANWSSAQVGWYDMIWNANGSKLPDGSIDAESGREALIGAYTGQILPPTTFRAYTDKKGNTVLPPTEYFQNHAVIYYNDTAAGLLGKIWKDPFDPDLSDTQYPCGSVVVKIEFVTLDSTQWGAMENSFGPNVFRPTVKDLLDSSVKVKPAKIVPTTFSQLVVKVKDTVASPDTGWVFMVFAYDKDVPGTTPDTVWDRATAVGAMWGNDPELANNPGGIAPNGGALQETWINPDAPKYAMATLGWGGRLSGPMDLGTRHNVVTVSGERYACDPAPGECPTFPASSCLSCHGSSQFPFVMNLYPSPNLIFPRDGKDEFLLYDPGTAEWAEWFQNRSGNEAMAGSGWTGIVATDYDMLLTFSIMAANAAAGGNDFLLHHMPGH